MTTYSYSSPIDHTTDAGFQAWAQGLHLALIAAGLVNTADTGQVDLTTAVRPAINTAAGYKIYRFNDALQATAPIYLKLEFGTGGSNNIYAMWLTVGTGTNGAGVINATGSGTRRTITPNASPTSYWLNWPTYICVAPGYAGLCFKSGAQQNPGGFHIFRSSDAAGALTTEGCMVYFGAMSGTSPFYTQVTLFPATVNAAGLSGTCWIGPYNGGGSPTTGAVGLDVQVYKHYSLWPRMRCNPMVLSAFATDIPQDTIFTETPVGATVRTYRALGTAWSYAAHFGAGGTAVNCCLCMLWE